jgi:hypothetical protein
MTKREDIIAAVQRGKQYKNIAADNDCTQTWVSKVARRAGYRRNKRRLAGAPLVQTTIALTKEIMDELKSRGRMAIQIRQAVEEYLERQRTERPNNNQKSLLRSGMQQGSRL